MSLLMAGIVSAIKLLTKKEVNKAQLLVEGKDPITVQFNPESFQIERKLEYQHFIQKENENSVITFSGMVQPVMSVSLFFDTSGGVAFNGIDTMAQGDVSELVDQFTEFTQISPELHRPPFVVFAWGTTVFQGVIQNISTSYTMFTKDGVPIRAKMDLVIQGIPDATSSKIPLQSPDRTKARVVTDESSIWGLAGKEYGDISQWREIARANGVMDPFAIPQGTVLKVPALIK